MVDVDKIKRDLDKYFTIDGSIKIDPSTGVVDVDGDVTLMKSISLLPVKFGTVSGKFVCRYRELTSLEGSPHYVGGEFNCYTNQLTSLEGSPRYVGGYFYCSGNPLTSFQGAPDHVGGEFVCAYNESLPLLRLVVYQRAYMLKVPPKVEEIIRKYEGEGKPGALKAAAELIRAGYKENARW